MYSNRTVLFLIIIMILLQSNVRPAEIPTQPISLNDISCHRVKCGSRCDLPLVDKNFRHKNKRIFFIETSCLGGLKTKLSCSVESAAIANPHWNITVLFAGPIKPIFKNSKTFKRLMSLPNVSFYKFNTASLARRTALQSIFSKNMLKDSLFPVGHASDFMKLLVMHTFGGLYLDLDVIVMKSFDSLPKNFIALQAKGEIASGIFAVARDRIGRNFTNISIRDLAEHFDLTSWAGNSNKVYTRTLQKMCGKKKLLHENICRGFHIMGYNLFYPIRWQDWILYYLPGNVSNYDHALMHHTWNSYGVQVKLRKGTLLAKLYEKYCPMIYDLLKGTL